jgi:hypothetical protein
MLEESLQRARSETHIGFLRIPLSLVPRVIGRGGSGLERIRSYGVSVDFVGRRDSDTRTSLKELDREPNELLTSNFAFFLQFGSSGNLNN